MKYYHIILILAFSVFACTLEGEEDSEDFVLNEKARDEFFENVFNDDQIESQVFTIQGNRDTLISTENGTKLQISEGTFSLNNKVVQGPIEIRVKEAFEPSDIVFANLTTTSADDGNLQTAGMIHIEALSVDEPLEMTDDSYIGAVVPTDKVDDEMKIWQGERKDGQIDWEEDDDVQNAEIQSLIRTWKQPWYFHDGLPSEDWDDFYNENRDSIQQWTYDEDIQIGDSRIIGGVNLRFSRWKDVPDTIQIMNFGSMNQFAEDFETNYIFKISNLGWANIDRLYDDPRSEEVKLIAEVKNLKDFDFVYTSLVFKDEDMYLPGYQREDRTYGFTHYDSEKPILPIGAKAVMIFTAYRDGVPHYAVEEFKIEKEGSISVHLVEATMKGMKANLAEILG